MTAPFVPVQVSAKAGNTVKITNVSATNVRSTITITSPTEANAILVTNTGTAGAGTGSAVFVRVSAEAAPTATAADIPLGVNQSVQIQNPVPSGTVGIAVKGVGATANDVYFTPIETKLND